MNKEDQGPSRADAARHIHDARLGKDAEDALVANLDETVLLGCVGLDADRVDACDATLVSVVIDMSGSMGAHARAVIEAYNTMQKALADAKAAGAILTTTWTFSDALTLLSGFEPIAKKPPLTSATFRPTGGTALYDAVLAAMTGLVSYGQALWDGGIPTRRVLFVLSDGEDNASRASVDAVQRAASALARDEAYTLAFAGFGGQDLAGVARAMGFPHVLAASASPAEIRAVFRQVSQSVLRVSQGARPGATFGFF
ncbi:MAG: hypothetical protein U0414_27990 [Polyangiaceae bacterium]